MTPPDTLAGRIENEIEQARKRVSNVAWQLSLLNRPDNTAAIGSLLGHACADLHLALTELRKPALQRMLKRIEGP